MRSRAPASIAGDRSRDRMPSESKLGDGRDKNRRGGAGADFDLAHQAEGGPCRWLHAAEERSGRPFRHIDRFQIRRVVIAGAKVLPEGFR